MNRAEFSVAALRLALSSLQFSQDAALQMIADYTLELFSAAGVAIALQRGQDVLCVASAGQAPAVGAILSTDAGVSGECFRTGEIVRCGDSHSDPRIDASIRRTLGFRSVVVLPIKKEKQLVGILEVLGATPYQFRDDDLSALQEISDLSLEVTQAKIRRTDPINTTLESLTEDLSPASDVREGSSSADLANDDLNAIFTKLDPDFQKLFQALAGDQEVGGFRPASVVPDRLRGSLQPHSELGQHSNKVSSFSEKSLLKANPAVSVLKKKKPEPASGMRSRRLLTIITAVIVLVVLFVTTLRLGIIP